MYQLTPPRIAIARVTEEPLSMSEHANAVADPACGAAVTFAGVVRDHDHGRHVTELRYEGHPNAADVLTRVVAEVARSHTDVVAYAASHRIGQLGIGDIALAVAVASPHRTAAVAGCALLVDPFVAAVGEMLVFPDRQLTLDRHRSLAVGPGRL